MLGVRKPISHPTGTNNSRVPFKNAAHVFSVHDTTLSASRFMFAHLRIHNYHELWMQTYLLKTVQLRIFNYLRSLRNYNSRLSNDSKIKYITNKFYNGEKGRAMWVILNLLKNLAILSNIVDDSSENDDQYGLTVKALEKLRYDDILLHPPYPAHILCLFCSKT